MNGAKGEIISSNTVKIHRKFHLAAKTYILIYHSNKPLKGSYKTISANTESNNIWWRVRHSFC
jgi:hypothetical protein